VVDVQSEFWGKEGVGGWPSSSGIVGGGEEEGEVRDDVLYIPSLQPSRLVVLYGIVSFPVYQESSSEVLRYFVWGLGDLQRGMAGMCGIGRGFSRCGGCSR